MKYSVKYKRVFDKEDNIVDISNITPENKQAEYYSIGTHTPMIAVLGEKRQHYFRAKRGYELNPETELHNYAKSIFKYRFDTEEQFYIMYDKEKICLKKDCIFYDEYSKGCKSLEKIPCKFDLKQYYDTATIEGGYNGYVADVLLTSSTHSSRVPVFLEIYVTHPCSKEKINSNNKIVEVNVTCENDAYIILQQHSEEDYYSYDDKEKVTFYNFTKEVALQNCKHYAQNKIYAQQTPVELGTNVKTKFYCYPHVFTNTPLKTYYENVKIGMLFASNKYAKPFVYDKALSLDEEKLVILGKDIYGSVKSWVVYIITWNGRYFRHIPSSHFDYLSALKIFTLAKGDEWTRGDTLSDMCT